MSELLFEEFPKIHRLKRGCVITEKIDGTNAQVNFDEEGRISKEDFSDILYGYTTGPFRKEGKATALLFPKEGRLKNQRCTDKPEYTYAYEAAKE